jgi:hypothetical protein
MTLAAAAVVAVGVAAVYPESNSDSSYVYGRFLAVMTPTFSALGVACLLDERVRARLRRSLVGAAIGVLLATYGIVRLYAGEKLLRASFIDVEVPTVATIVRPFISSHQASTLRPQIATGLAIIVFLVAFVLAELAWRRLLVGLLILVGLVVSVGAYLVIVRPRDRLTFPGGRTGMDVPAVVDSRNVAWDTSLTNRYWQFRYAYYARNSRLEFFDQSIPPPDAQTVIARNAWDGAPFGFRRDGPAPGVGATVWVRS